MLLHPLIKGVTVDAVPTDGGCDAFLFDLRKDL
jgi:hypothetical protein